MNKNKILFLLAVILFPLAVISFFIKDKEANIFLPSINEFKPSDNHSVKVLKDDKILTLDLEDYIVGVVAGEMPASFEKEALKAQAVASRSYALYKVSTSNNEYDLTADASTQVYLNEEEMREKWGSDYDKYYSKVHEAVYETEGEVAIYNGKIISAYYFSMSSGETQNSEYVFGETKDYLKKVSSEYDNSNLASYEVTKTFTMSEFKEKLNLNCDNITIQSINKNESNYVENITICNQEFKGTTFRSLLSLRSASFDIEVSDEVNITTYGYGHGVGMSQYGANGYAQNGYDYRAILKHYYQNIEIKSIKDV